VEVYPVVPVTYPGAFDITGMPMYVDENDDEYWNVEELTLSCNYCDTILAVMYNALLPFEGNFHVRCPKCERLLVKKEDFKMFSYECDCKKTTGGGFDNPDELV
jgi:hypothetical protein